MWMNIHLQSCVCVCCLFVFFFFKQKTAYEMRISDWSSDVCSSDLATGAEIRIRAARAQCPGQRQRRVFLAERAVGANRQQALAAALEARRRRQIDRKSVV